MNAIKGKHIVNFTFHPYLNEIIIINQSKFYYYYKNKPFYPVLINYI